MLFIRWLGWCIKIFIHVFISKEGREKKQGLPSDDLRCCFSACSFKEQWLFPREMVQMMHHVSPSKHFLFYSIFMWMLVIDYWVDGVRRWRAAASNEQWMRRAQAAIASNWPFFQVLWKATPSPFHTWWNSHAILWNRLLIISHDMVYI